ncbi:MAG: DUF4230 domain-containing protein [Erythrobacter sp.]
MADDLKQSESSIQPDLRGEQPLARIQAVPWLIVIVLLAAVAWLGWRAFFYQEEGDPVGSAMLAFEKQNSLTVFSSRFEIVAESVDRRGVLNLDLLESRQAAIIPATVEYRLDLSEIDRDDFEWDREARSLTVTVPQLRTSTPNLDEAQARVFTEGAWLTRDASTDLARNNSRQAAEKATAFAKNPQILAMARSAARDAIRQNLSIPLQLAGHGDVDISVRFENSARN